LSFIEKGTSPFAICKASHSTIAVLPTPASQTRQGLFFVFLLSIPTSLSISTSRPIILSIFPSLASAVRSVVKKSNAGVFDSIFFSVCGFASKGISPSCPKSDDCKPEKIFSARFQKSFSILASLFISSDF
jgi:hypothetical protein